jgi:putative inorganic carbon (HCO3(-)) transporter
MSTADLPTGGWEQQVPAPRASSAVHVRWSPDQFLDPLVLAVTAPLALFPSRFPPEAHAIGLGLLAVPYLVRQAKTAPRGRPASAGGAARWPLLFLLLVALPLGARQSPDFWEASWPELVRMVWGIAVCLGVINFCAGDRGWPSRRRLAPHLAVATAGFVALGLLFGGVGLAAMRTGTKFPLVEQLLGWLPAMLSDGALGLSLNPNRVAGLLVLYPSLLLALLLAAAPHARATPIWWLGKGLLVGLLAFFSMALLLTQSRTALLAALCSVGVVSLLAGRRGWIVLGLGALVAAASLSVLGPGGVVDMVAVQSPDAEGAAPIARLLADRDVAGRFLLWQRAGYAILDAPLTGIGINAFHLLAQEPYPRLPNFRPDPDITHAHNLFLQTGLDLGLPGLLAYSILLVMAGMTLFRLWSDTQPGRPARLWVVGMAGALTAFLIFNLLDAVTLGARPAVANWYLLGLVLGAGVLAQPSRVKVAARCEPHTSDKAL